jgi:hypothetical protein
MDHHHCCLKIPDDLPIFLKRDLLCLRLLQPFPLIVF